MRESVIVSAVRTPTGRFLGGLREFQAPQLGAMVVREAVRRAGIDPAIVDECIMGNVVTAGLGQNPARQAALNGGLHESVAALTINKVCGSGLKAVMLADQAIRVGDIDVAVAGGMESMSNCPYLLPRVRDGLRMGNGEVIDSMINDGLWCAFEMCHMGNAGEVVAEHYKVGRFAQDEYAARSHQKAAQATASGAFKAEILPIETGTGLGQKGRRDLSPKGAPVVIDRDEPIREDTTADTLAKLKPAFKKDGTVTAGNSSGINDGAAALLIMSAEKAVKMGIRPLARIVSYGCQGCEPLAHSFQWHAGLPGNLNIESLTVFLQAVQDFHHGHLSRAVIDGAARDCLDRCRRVGPHRSYRGTEYNSSTRLAAEPYVLPTGRPSMSHVMLGSGFVQPVSFVAS